MFSGFLRTTFKIEKCVNKLKKSVKSSVKLL